MDASRLLPDGARDLPDTPSSTSSPPERDRTIFSLSADPSFSAYYEALQPLLWILRLLGLWQPPTAGTFATRVYPVLISLSFLALPWVLFVLNLVTDAVSRSGIFGGLYQLPLMMLNLVSLSAFYYARIYFKSDHLRALLLQIFPDLESASLQHEMFISASRRASTTSALAGTAAAAGTSAAVGTAANTVSETVAVHFDESLREKSHLPMPSPPGSLNARRTSLLTAASFASFAPTSTSTVSGLNLGSRTLPFTGASAASIGNSGGSTLSPSSLVISSSSSSAARLSFAAPRSSVMRPASFAAGAGMQFRRGSTIADMDDMEDSLTALDLEVVSEGDQQSQQVQQLQQLQQLQQVGADARYRSIRGAGSSLGAAGAEFTDIGPAPGFGRPVVTARPIATLENFRALVRRELKYFVILLVIAIGFLAPFTVTNQSDISRTGTTSFFGWVLVIYQILQRIFTFSIYSIFSRHFILVCGCHSLDVEQHLLRYKLALKSSFFSDEAIRQIFADAAELGGTGIGVNSSSIGDVDGAGGSGILANRASSNAALGTSVRLALEGFFHELTSEFLRMNKLVRATSKAFRAFVGIAITLSFVEALISVWIYITSSTDPKSPHTWDQFWLLVPCTLYFYMSSACLYSAAKINHMGMNISRLGVELQCGLRSIFANIRVSPAAAAGAGAAELDEEERILPLDISAALSTHDMIYLQNTCAALCTLVNFRPIGVSLWGVTMNRQFFLSLISPLAAFALFFSQRYLTLYSPGGSP